MDGSSNGFNKAIVLIAVAISGIAAGQHLFRQGSPIAPQGPWGSNYLAQMPMAVYPPQAYPPPGALPSGYPQPGYPQSGYPQASYGPQVYSPQGYGQPGMAPLTEPLPPMANGGHAPDPIAGQTSTANRTRPSRPTRVRRDSMPLQRIAHHTGDEQSPDEEDDVNDLDPLPITEDHRANREIVLTSGITPTSVVTATKALVPASLAAPQLQKITASIVKIEADSIAWNDEALKLTPVVTGKFLVYVKMSAIKDQDAANCVFSINVDAKPAKTFTPATTGIRPKIKDLSQGIKEGEFTYGPIGVDVSDISSRLNGEIPIELTFSPMPGNEKDFVFSNINSVKIQVASPPPDDFKVTTASTRFAELIPYPSQSNEQSIFGGFLRIGGKFSGYKDVRFLLAKNITTIPEIFKNLGANLPVLDNMAWEKELDLSSLGNASGGTLLIIAQKSDGSVYEQKITLVTKPIAATGDINIALKSVEKQTKSETETVPVNSILPNLYFSNSGLLTYTVQVNRSADQAQVALFQAGSNTPLATGSFPSSGLLELTLTPEIALKEGDHALYLEVFQGKSSIAHTEPFSVSVRASKPYPISVSPTNLAETPGSSVIRVRFNPENQLDRSRLNPTSSFILTNVNKTKDNTISPSTAAYDETDNVVVLMFPDIPEGAYKLTVSQPSGADSETVKSIKDLNGNPLKTGTHEFGIVKPIGSELSSTPTAGLKNSTGPNVAYPEFTEPRKSSVGFNPSDKVVTKIARLYYFRDAHRVVQLVNREARSYNRQGVDVQQQLTDNSRRQADDATGERQGAERAAIQAASQARAAEQMLKQYQQGLIESRKQLTELDKTAVKQEGEQEKLEKDLDAAKEKTRLADEKVKSTQPTLPADQLALDNAKQDEAKIKEKLNKLVGKQKRTEADKGKAEDQITAMEGHVSAAMAAVQTARNLEAEKRELSATSQFKEDRARADLFRREVAAAKEDPDTYAPGNPTSQDPMLQVSLSVIGEGLIQLRGPSKGVNLVRTLINQIDAPVGQVRIGIHSVQVNGEHGKRMEPVIGRIQLYVDHSRFLTVQSGQMLRNAVTLVASRCADQAMIECAEQGQAARDQKYIASFFGQEFLDELQTLDSEFLQTGNKLLSLHSMDSTSLANALFLLSLAKNDVRQQILTEFDRMVTTQLPLDEQEYFIASAEQYKFGPMFHKTKFQFLAHNAKFVSLKGFFNAEVAGAETLTPMQREFIRLAQIFKSRLVTELELQQRVMERSLIEDRIDNYSDKQKTANIEEGEAEEKLKENLKKHHENRIAVLNLAESIEAYAAATRSIAATITEMAYGLKEMVGQVEIAFEDTNAKQNGSWKNPDGSKKKMELNLSSRGKRLTMICEDQTNISFDAASATYISSNLLDCGRFIESADRQLKKFQLTQFDNENLGRSRKTIHDAIRLIQNQIKQGSFDRTQFKQHLDEIKEGTVAYVSVGKHVVVDATAIRVAARDVVQYLGKASPDVPSAIRRWVVVEAMIKNFVNLDEFNHSRALLNDTSNAFKSLSKAAMAYESQLRIAESSRRPLDHKKFLDMLIDDVEDKFIELMEGTRAHTANIDNYLSRLGQALDDDFQTQFYNPAFKGIREAGRYWDVQMGQIETTTVLTNNRMFAKVSPQATMEFDLPKRSILIQEAMKSGMAAYDDYGALLGDPTFLALTKMHGGQAASAVFNRDNSSPTVRSLLPGLPSTGNESLIAQSGAAAPDFPSALESLIPDPAIYKFETGTGYEIRPVIQPDGQAVVFHFNYMYTTNIREPVRADEKHLGRVKRHYIDTDVQTGNYELREVSRYQVALKASRTSRGVPFLEDLPGAGILFRPLPNQESSLQQNLILAQTVIFPTLYDLMGLRWAPVVADMDALRLQEADFVTRSRQRSIRERVFDYSSQQVDEFLRIPAAERRTDLYRSQETTPMEHPNGYQGRGMKIKDGTLREGYTPEATRPDSHFIPGTSAEGAVRPGRRAHAGAFTSEAVLQESSPLPQPTSTSELPEEAGSYQSHPPQAEGRPSIYDEEYRDQTQGEDQFDPHQGGNLPVIAPPSPQTTPDTSDESLGVPPALTPVNGQYRSLFKSPLNRVAKPSSNSAIQLQSYQSETRSRTATEDQKPPRKVETAPKKGTQPSGVNRPEGKPAGAKPWSFKRPAAKPATLQPTAAKSAAMKPAESNPPPAMLPGVTTRQPSSWRTLEGSSGVPKRTTTTRAGYSQVGEPSMTDSQSDSTAIKTLPGAHERRDSHIVQVKGTEPEPASKTQKVRNPLLAWPKKP